MTSDLTLALADPKNLIRESFRIEAITPAECRSIFVDWALSLPPGVDAAPAIRFLIDHYAPDASPAEGGVHPMVAILVEGLQARQQDAPRRRGGRAARFAE